MLARLGVRKPAGQRPAAMVSRIRVEVRGETMEAAESVAFDVMNQIQMVGVLEGVMPMDGEYSDHHFHRPEVTTKPGEGPEPWGELGLSYAGRLSFTFAPMVTDGGLRQFGYEVKPAEGDQAPFEFATEGEPHHGYVVLQRNNPVTREQSYELSALRDYPGETGESILDDIRTIHPVLGTEARLDKEGCTVVAHMKDGAVVSESGASLREAAARARKRVLEVVEKSAAVVPLAETTPAQ